MKKMWQYFYPVVFFLTLCLFCLFSLKEDLPLEKRKATQPPAFTFQSGVYSQNMEKFLADQIPFRSFFVASNAYFQLYTGRNVTMSVYQTKDGALVEKPITGDTQIAQKNLEKYSAFCKTQGMRPFTMIVPTAGYIRQADLPKPLQLYRDDAYLATLQQAFPSLSFVEVLPALQETPNAFYKGDHHWTIDGVTASVNEFCKASGIPMLDAPADTLPGFHGTTYAKSGLYLTPPEPMGLPKIQGTYRITFEKENHKINHSSLLFTKDLNPNDMYALYLNGNHGLTFIHNDSATTKRTLLVFKDSFANAFLPHLAPHYKTIALVDMRSYRKPVSALCKEYAFDDCLLLYGLDTLMKDKNLLWIR